MFGLPWWLKGQNGQGKLFSGNRELGSTEPPRTTSVFTPSSPLAGVKVRLSAKRTYRNTAVTAAHQIISSRTRSLKSDRRVSDGSMTYSLFDAVFILPPRMGAFSRNPCLLYWRVGAGPSASAESNLLALETGLGQLAIYDLNTAAKLDEEIFPDAIAYTHFSADGQRLFALIENQYAFRARSERRS
jgi:hypothetical protein